MADTDFDDKEELSTQEARDIIAMLNEQNSKKVTPTSLMEGTLSVFVKDVCDEVRDQDAYAKEVRKQILKNLPTMSNKELIALDTSIAQTKNDLISKTVSPTMQLLTQAQINEINERKEQQKALEAKASPQGISQLALQAPNDVMVGFKAISDLVNLFQQSGDVSITKNVTEEEKKIAPENNDDFKPDNK